jgi:hypothetical protein
MEIMHKRRQLREHLVMHHLTREKRLTIQRRKRSSMPKRATVIVLSAQELEELLQITRRHRSEQQVAKRAHIVLAAAQGRSNTCIAHELDIHVHCSTKNLTRRCVQLAVKNSWLPSLLASLARVMVHGSLHLATAPQKFPAGEF